MGEPRILYPAKLTFNYIDDRQKQNKIKQRNKTTNEQTSNQKIQGISLLEESIKEQALDTSMTVKTLIKGLMVSIMCIFTLDLILKDGKDSNGNVICRHSTII